MSKRNYDKLFSGFSNGAFTLRGGGSRKLSLDDQIDCALHSYRDYSTRYPPWTESSLRDLVKQLKLRRCDAMSEGERCHLEHSHEGMHRNKYNRHWKENIVSKSELEAS